MKIKITVEGIIDKNFFRHRTYIHDDINERRKLLSDKVIDLEEKAVQEALIKLGWTPPAKEKYYVLCNNKKQYCNNIKECWNFIEEQPFGALSEIRYTDNKELVTSEIPY